MINSGTVMDEAVATRKRRFRMVGGTYRVSVNTPFGKRTVNTKQASLDKAHEMCEQVGVWKREEAVMTSNFSMRIENALVHGEVITLDKARGRWLDFMEETGRPIKTRLLYGSNVDLFLRRIGAGRLPNSIEMREINKYINDSSKNKLQTRVIKLYSLKHFFGFCHAKGYHRGNPTHGVEVNIRNLTHEQIETTPPKIFTPEAFAQLLAEIDRKAGVFRSQIAQWTGKSCRGTQRAKEAMIPLAQHEFWRIAAQLAYWTGLREGDICGLEWQQVADPEKIVVWTSKRDRKVDLPYAILPHGKELRELITTLEAGPRKCETFMFPKWNALYQINPPEATSQAQQYFRRMKGYKFSGLRATFIHECDVAGMTFPHIAALVGHSHTNTTLGYVRGRPEGWRDKLLTKFNNELTR